MNSTNATWSYEDDERVLESFRTNSVVLDEGGARWVLHPADDVKSVKAPPAPAFSGYVVPSVFGPVTSVWDRVLEAHEWWRADLERHWCATRSAWFVDAQRRWVEPAVLVDALRHEVAVGDLRSRLLNLCAVRGVPWIVQVEAGEFHVIAVESGEVLGTQRFDVAQVGAGCAVNGATKVCTMTGGPWTSASRCAARRWFGDRSRLVAAFGCSVCSGERYEFAGAEYEGNPIISLTEPSVPTRWMRVTAE